MQQNKYATGKIYVMYDPYSHFYYIGSTTKTIQERLLKHITSSKLEPEREVYKAFNEIGWDKIKIDIIQDASFETKNELLELENEYIFSCLEDQKCLNSCLAWTGLDNQQYQKLYSELNKEEISKKHHLYYLKNRDTSIDRVRNYYIENRKRVLEYHKRYRKENKDKISEYIEN